MKTKLLSLTLLAFSFGTIIGQNLVPNNGFETQTSCPLSSEIEKAIPWNSPNNGTPDLFNSTCPTQNGLAHTGVGSAGFYCYSVFPNNREYVQVALDQTLVAGNTYCVEFYVKPANFRLAVADIGAYFSNIELSLAGTSVINETPDVINQNGVVMGTSTWTKIDGEFIANGGEQYLVIGNFSNDANTTTGILNSMSNDTVSYYKIDDVSVVDCTPIDTTGTSLRNRNQIAFELGNNPNKTGIFTVQLDNNNSDINIEVFSVLGTKIFEVSGNQEVFTIDLSREAKGTYFITISDDKQLLSTGKLMKN